MIQWIARLGTHHTKLPLCRPRIYGESKDEDSLPLSDGNDDTVGLSIMFSPLAILRRDAEKRDIRVGEVSGLTTTGGGVLGGGVFGSSLLMPDRGREAGVSGRRLLGDTPLGVGS